MKFLYLALALPTLTWAVVPEDVRARWDWDFQTECHRDCPAQQPARCECENANAIRCAGPLGGLPILKPCAAPSPRPFIAATPTTLNKTQESGKPRQTSQLPPAATPQQVLDKTGTIPYPSRTAANPSKVPKPYGTPLPPPPPPQPSRDPTTSPPVYIPPSQCSISGLPGCPDGQTCIPDPFAPDDADYTGFCIRLNDSVCGPVFEVACPSSLQNCVDDPREECVAGVCPGTCVFLDLNRDGGEVIVA